MISLTTAQWEAWIAGLFYPLTRILAFVAAAPLWSSASIPRRLRLILGLAIAFAVAPMLPPMPNVAPASGIGLWILAQQVLIGVAMGLAARIIFAAIDVAGEYISMQMGLGFATSYDPTASSQTAVVTEFYNLMVLLVFLSINGHLMYIATLVQSFTAIPVSATPLGAASWLNLAELGGRLFAIGLLLALPAVTALMIVNIALAVLTKAAPQLNIMSIGFPLTLSGGLIAIALSLNYLNVPLQAMFEEALQATLGFARLAR